MVSGFGKQKQNKKGKNKMGTISKCNIGGHDFYYEKVTYVSKSCVSIFAVKDDANAKEFDLYWVVAHRNLNMDEDCSAPNKGHVVCMCKEVTDARMIASAINIAFTLSTKSVDELIKDSPLDDIYDTDAMGKEIHRLHSEGKSDDEIFKIMKSKRDSFLRKKPTEVKKDGGEW